MQRMRNRTRKTAGLLIVALALAWAPPAAADDYEPDRAGHPVRIVAYVLHPIGVALDYLIFRPAHWVGHQEPFKSLCGYDDR